MKKTVIAIAIAIAAILIIIAVALHFKDNSSDTKSSDTPASASESQPDEAYDVGLSLTFCGSCVLTEGEAITTDETISSLLSQADFTWAENDCTYSEPNTPGILSDMGIDIISLANENVLTNGEESFNDTMVYLSSAGIEYAGAGYDIVNATTPVYLSVGDVTVAYICACDSSAENAAATEDKPGIFTYSDTSELTDKVTEADEVADVVVCLPHWSTPDVDMAHLCIDAGADIVIGMTNSSYSGMEAYNDKPILYSLGSFISSDENEGIIASFNLEAEKTVSGGGTSLSVKSSSLAVTPVISDTGEISVAEGDALAEMLEAFRKQSSGDISVDESGEINY